MVAACFKELSHWLNYLETRHVQEIQLGLSRVLALGKHLDLLTWDAQVITVAGTNGKGSTTAALESIYLAAGYRVGTYTSPHLLRFNERIKVGGKPIEDAFLCDAFSVLEEAPGGQALSYFEATTLAALWYFKQQTLDVILLEVGLGGRLDATNIVDADLAIITTIDFDHQQLLGNTLEAIGYEKAGILRKNTPFIYADSNPVNSILERASQLGCPGYFYAKDYLFHEEQDYWTLQSASYTLDKLPKPSIGLPAAAASLVATLILSKKLPVSREAYHLGLQQVFIAGRLQWQRGLVNVLYDVSHNPQSVRLLAKTVGTFLLQAVQAGKKPTIHAVFSALQEKDIPGLIRPLRDCVNAWYPAQLECKRAASSEMLLSAFKSEALLVDICYNSPVIAFEKAREQVIPGDLILVFGSFYTVGAVMAEYYQE